MQAESDDYVSGNEIRKKLNLLLKVNHKSEKRPSILNFINAINDSKVTRRTQTKLCLSQVQKTMMMRNRNIFLNNRYLHMIEDMMNNVSDEK